MPDPNAMIDVAAALAALEGEFRADELAYLAATMKVENPVRDRLAYLLHRRYGGQGLIVSREWNRVDIAVLRPDGEPACLIELKAMYTFDALADPTKFFEATTKDELKAREAAGAATGAEVYSLLLATHLGSPVEERYAKAVKYSARGGRAFANGAGGDALRQSALAAVDRQLSGRHVTQRGELQGGRAFGVDVSVLYWLMREKPIRDRSSRFAWNPGDFEISAPGE
jgi:hypothetical protein